VTVLQDAEVTERYLPLPDLDDRDHIRHLVIAFYREVVSDELLGPVFPEALVLPVTQDDVPRRILELAAVAASDPLTDGHSPTASLTLEAA
jgi:hypothetical protein